MAPSHSRQLLVWTFPTIAILLSYLWFKRKRIGLRSDPGGIELPVQKEEIVKQEQQPVEVDKPRQSSEKITFSRSLSGVETAPIDIILPKQHRLAKSQPIIISDEDLDFEIEKIKLLNDSEHFNKPIQTLKPQQKSPEKETIISKTPSPKEEKNTPLHTSVKSPDTTPVKSSNITPVKSLDISPIKSLEIAPIKLASNLTTPVKLPDPSPPINKSVIKSEKKAKSKMAQKDLVCEKFGNMKLKDTPKKKNKNKSKVASSNINSNVVHEDIQRQSSERDSANHSPAEVMLASPSLSSISDNHSEVSFLFLLNF